MEYKNVEGFEFVKIGQAYWCESGVNVTHQGKKLSWHVALELVDQLFLNAEQSTYLVYVNGEQTPVYVGEYSNSFSDRWLRRDKYFWHSDNVDDKVKELVLNGDSITIWLSVEPYAITTEGHSININKAIEQKLIENLQPTWNIRGKGIQSNSKTIKVSEILASIE